MSPPNRLPSLLVLTLAAGVSACSADRATGSRADDAGRGAENATAVDSAPAPDSALARMEVEYITSSIDHHAAGAQMAALCVRQATHEDLRHLCRRSGETQTEESRRLQEWLRVWYAASHEPRVGPSDQRTIDALAALSGGQFEAELMRALVRQHEVIVQRSHPVVWHAHHAELRHLAASVIEQGRHDNTVLRHWLCVRYYLCHV